jgi:curli biogenesis system outer membrane secretion channel CsgG
MKTISILASAALLLTLTPTTASAQFGRAKPPAKTQELPRCAQPVGTVAIQEPENRWWVNYNLSSPEALIKLMAARSNCLRVVDRGRALAMRNIERDLADSGELRRESNVGRGQVKAADYVIIPDIVNSDSNASGSAVAGIAGGLIGGRFGGLIGGIKSNRLEAQTMLTLVDTRTTEQVYSAEGTAAKNDIGWGAGGGYAFFGGVGGGYADTEIGKVITQAYVDAFIDLVGYMGGGAMQPGAASANAGAQAMNVATVTTMRQSASPQATSVRTFKVGDMVYPTGQKNGIWWEIDDETGNRGWVVSTALTARPAT